MISRAERRAARTGRVTEVFGAGQVETALDLFETMEIAWHDLYGEITPAESVIDDALALCGGDLGALIRAVRLGLADSRDLKAAADRARSGG